MRARVLPDVGPIGADWPDPRLPPEVLGWTAVGIAEVLTDRGLHQAYGLILQDATTRSPRRLVLWWQREPSRRWVLTPLDL